LDLPPLLRQDYIGLVASACRGVGPFFIFIS